MNGSGHVHRCLDCGAPYTCDLPECERLLDFGACLRCGGTLRVTQQTDELRCALVIPRRDQWAKHTTTTGLLGIGR